MIKTKHTTPQTHTHTHTTHTQSVAECTLQPVRRYDIDAAILFSDILVIAEALGIEVTMPGGVGILIPEPLAGPEEVATRIPSLDQIDEAFVEDKLGHVFEAVRQIRSKMEEEGKSVPLIGFSAAPWTLLFYMVGGSSRKNQENGTRWLNEHPEESQKLLDILTKVVIEYMSKQVENGTHMLQVFEAMGMMIDEENFDKFALPCLKQISSELKSRYPDVPLMVFSRGASFANEGLSKLEYDVITIDGGVDRSTARATVGDSVALQGNYDPRELIEDAEGTKTPETVRATAREMLEALGPQKLIANLGEGLGGKESTTLVDAFVTAIHEESASMISAATE
jgi:uroporphyrinogen decarboxylase